MEADVVDLTLASLVIEAAQLEGQTTPQQVRSHAMQVGEGPERTLSPVGPWL